MGHIYYDLFVLIILPYTVKNKIKIKLKRIAIGRKDAILLRMSQPVSCRFPKAPWYNTYTEHDGTVLTYDVPYDSGTVRERFVHICDDSCSYYVKLDDSGVSNYRESPWYTNRIRLCHAEDMMYLPYFPSILHILEKHDPQACLWKLQQGYPCVNGDPITLIRDAIPGIVSVSQRARF